jgi:hypothetical protein
LLDQQEALQGCIEVPFKFPSSFVCNLSDELSPYMVAPIRRGVSHHAHLSNHAGFGISKLEASVLLANFNPEVSLIKCKK